MVNQVKYEYNANGRLEKEYQAHSGSVNTSTTPYVGYSYDTTKSGDFFTKALRPTSMIYPDGRDLYYGYGTSGSVDDVLNRVATFIWGQRYIDDLVLRDRSTERLYSLADPNWNVLCITDENASVQSRLRYDAYGTASVFNASYASASLPTNWSYAFTTRRLDAETGCMYYRNRYYHPKLGRFQKRDPIGYEDSLNLFRYVGSMPISGVAPSGLFGFVEEVKSLLDAPLPPPASGGAAFTLPVIRKAIPIPWIPGLAINFSITGEATIILCCDGHQAKHFIEGSVYFEIYGSVGMSFGKYKPPGRGGRNERVPHPTDPSRTIKRKDAGKYRDPDYGYRDRWGHMTFNEFPPCPDSWWVFDGEVFLRGSIGAYFAGAQFSLSQPIRWDMDITDPDKWDLSWGLAAGVSGVSVELGGGVSVSFNIPLGLNSLPAASR